MLGKIGAVIKSSPKAVRRVLGKKPKVSSHILQPLGRTHTHAHLFCPVSCRFPRSQGPCEHDDMDTNHTHALALQWLQGGANQQHGGLNASSSDNWLVSTSPERALHHQSHLELLAVITFVVRHAYCQSPFLAPLAYGTCPWSLTGCMTHPPQYKDEHVESGITYKVQYLGSVEVDFDQANPDANQANAEAAVGLCNAVL